MLLPLLFFLFLLSVAEIASEAFAEAVTGSFEAIRRGDRLPPMKTLEESILNGTAWSDVRENDARPV